MVFVVFFHLKILKVHKIKKYPLKLVVFFFFFATIKSKTMFFSFSSYLEDFCTREIQI